MVGQPLNPQWCFRAWNAEQKRVRSRKGALEHGQILNILSTLRKCIPEDRVLTCFRATRLLTEKLEDRCCPFFLNVGAPALVDSAAPKVVGIRWRPERLERQPIVKALEALEQTFKDSSMCDWNQSGSSSKQGQDSAMKARSQLFVWACNLSQVNPRNVCYLNSSVIAMASAGVVAAKPAAYGTLAASFSAVLAAGGVYVLHLRSWMPVLQHWANLQQQQDAGEFLAFLLRRANRPACAGSCVARRNEQGHTQVLDEGTLSAPQPIALQGNTLKVWERQRATHALMHSGGLIMVQLMRYLRKGTRLTWSAIPYSLPFAT